MSAWYAKAVVFLASVVMIAIRAPHGQRSRSMTVKWDAKGRREVVLLSIAWLGFVIPFFWIVSPLFAFADYPLAPGALLAGVALFAAGLWLFYRSHADLGRNWSVTLQIREDHQLVTEGVYRYLRHPMYLALFLYSIGQMLALPNWFAGPSYLVSFGILFALRLHAEERMMLDEFGDRYLAYMARTKRLIPGVW